MHIEVKKFKELTVHELYGLLQLRSEVFVVEQDCVYQDLDGKDKKAIHVIGKKNNVIVAYTRIFSPGDYFKEASIGRVVVKKSERQYGYGKVIMRASIKAVEEQLNTTKIRLSAQTYLLKFYNSLGFTTEGEGYLEDGIPHISMIKK
ncbi:GNAT family N-acetyltransferase [Maribacter sp. PR1]|uniref:GNAT family N-acetyltransferase n=1 Tax=Maribacter cobaltidurans TaxID=1178778 RepID=A0ABU7IQU8_9FLAO|nr:MULTISPECIES: GNAT family N-acetyltransferase [Maribacter]MDC6387849.1 GNAT family N-acetyltransferase [Maribacter sp. PR1]MEE1975238.1 GNAT family N-acetyltransferase [Maribacter cobaltidurans]